MHSAEIEEVWPRISEAVYRMLPDEEAHRMIEACRSGTALAFACEEAALVVTLRAPEGELELLIWAAVGTGDGLVEKYVPFLAEVARHVGAHRITFQPRRRGWPRRLRRLGDTWRLRDDGMFVMEVR